MEMYCGELLRRVVVVLCSRVSHARDTRAWIDHPPRFADHLKNTEYKWPFWKHWCNVLDLQPDNAQRVFVSNVLAALVKLSYTDR